MGVWSSWKLEYKAVDASSVRRIFRKTELFDSTDGSAALRAQTTQEQSSTIDKYLTFPLSTIDTSGQMPAELKRQVLHLVEVEGAWLGGTATPCLHCGFCTERLFLLDKRPQYPTPMRSCASTGEVHDYCAEKRHWKGAAVVVGDDDDDTSEEDSEEEELGRQAEDG